MTLAVSVASSVVAVLPTVCTATKQFFGNSEHGKATL